MGEWMVDVNSVVDIDNELTDCIIFIKKNYRVLAVDINNFSVRQRDEDSIDFIFSTTPNDIGVIEKFFTKFYSGEKIYYNISKTGFRAVHFKGISFINKIIGDSVRYNITLFTVKGEVNRNIYDFVLDYDDYIFKFVGDKYE